MLCMGTNLSRTVPQKVASNVKLLSIFNCLNITTRPVASLLRLTWNLHPSKQKRSGDWTQHTDYWCPLVYLQHAVTTCIITLTLLAISQGKSLSWRKHSTSVCCDNCSLSSVTSKSFRGHPYMNTFCFLLWPCRSQYKTTYTASVQGEGQIGYRVTHPVCLSQLLTPCVLANFSPRVT